MENDIKHEQKLLDMLGYSLILDNTNKWTILDDKEHPVGFIERIRRFRKNKKRGLPNTYQYTMSIESETISYNNTRIENHGESYQYEFYVKDKSGNQHFVDISCNTSCPNISIANDGYNDRICIDYRGLYCNFRSKTKKHFIEEIVVYRDAATDGITKSEYTYQINSCKKDKSLDDINRKNITSRVLSATADITQRLSERIALNVSTYRNNKVYKMSYSNEKDIPGTVEEVAIKNEMGIEAVSHLRYRFNEILPFKDEVFETMFKECQYLEKAGGRLFFPDIMTKGSKEHIKK